MDGTLSIIFIFSIPLVAIITKHKRAMAEMKLKMMNRGDEGLRAEVEALRNELKSLRDTSTQYDISFDTALQRVDRRVELLENHSVGYAQTDSRGVEIQTGR